MPCRHRAADAARAAARAATCDLRLDLARGPTSRRGHSIAPVHWVHSSDLADPTPFLSEGLVLLTTGTQFDDGEPRRPRLRRGGSPIAVSSGLGFGTEVLRDGIRPSSRARARTRGCRCSRCPTAPRSSPSPARNAEAIAAQAYARRTWALDAQRAIALAALRPDGLGATVAELAPQLDIWVGMFDAAGALFLSHPRDAVDAKVLDELGDRVMDILNRGLEAGQSLSIDEHSFMLFTVGRGGHLRGVIALAVDALDPEARSVVTSVIAMAGLAMEQSEQLARSRRRLHAQLLGITSRR